VTTYPNWIYDLSKREWRIFSNNGRKPVNVFAGASAYDSFRDVVVAYAGTRKGGVWELGPDRKEWRKAGGSRHEIHFNMAFDSANRKLVVFGDFKGSRDVWVFTPGQYAGQMGNWEKRTPIGNDCPSWQHYPVAYDAKNKIFLIVPKGVTCTYDVATNKLTRLPDLQINVGKMNYMMAYDIYHEVFLLVTGDRHRPPVVWALKLDPSVLP